MSINPRTLKYASTGRQMAIEITVDPSDLQRMIALFDGLLLEGYFRNGVTGYEENNRYPPHI